MEPFTFKDDRLKMEVILQDSLLYITLTDLQAGKKWGKVPLLRMEVYDKMQRGIDVIEKYVVDRNEHLNNGLHVIIGERFHGIRLGLWLRIINGELSVFLQPMEIYEDNPDIYRLFAIDLFPGLMLAEEKDSLLLPILSGMRCKPGNKPKITERFLIYGEQERWELFPTLPFCAVDAIKGGLMALSVKGASDTECRVNTDGAGCGTIGLGFSFRRYWNDPIDFENRNILFIPIPAGERADIFCSKRIRRHVVNDLKKPTLTQRAKESPEVAYLLKAYIMKMFFAIENCGIMMYEKDKNDPVTYKRVMTFKQAQTCLQKIHDAGITSVLTEMVGWNPRGHDGMYPTRLPPDERLGGEMDFRELILFGNNLGYHMSVHDNYIDSYKVAPNWDPETTIHDMFGEPLVSGFWGGGINYRQWPLAFSYERLEGEMRRVREYGVRGMYYCDGMGTPLEVNYHPRHRGPRSEYAKGICRILETAKKVAGSVGTEVGFLYCIVPADCIATTGWDWDLKKIRPLWPITVLCDELLPIWHLALHGLIVFEGHGHTWKDIMQKIVLGLHPRTQWCVEPDIIPVLDDALVKTLKTEYDLVLGHFGYLQTLAMTDWQKSDHQQIISRFEDGTEIMADFAAEVLTVNGKEVKRPEALI